MGVTKLRVYERHEREVALALADELGTTAAARKLGIPPGTLSCWKSLARRGKKWSPSPRKPKAAAPALTTARRTTSGSSAGSDRAKRCESLATGSKARVQEGHSSKTPGSAVAVESRNKGHKRVAKVYTPSQRAEALELAQRIGVSPAARELGISRFTLQEWRRKMRRYAEGDGGANPLYPASGTVEQDRDERILTVWREHRGLGPSQIRNQLRRAGLKVSVHTVRRVMEEAGYRPPKVRRVDAHTRRYEAVRPNHLWHLDFLHRHIHKQTAFILLVIDDYSRFIVGASVWDAERADAVIETFEEAVSRHGRPESVMTDGGSAFWAWRGVGRFTKILEEYGVDQIVAKVPQTNGKLEVLNANIQKELFDVERFFDLGETRRRLLGWVDFYNLRRTHHALGGLLVPADRYHGRADSVLSAIEAGSLGEKSAEPAPLGSRVLDLLRLTSHGGQLELCVMGQRLWPQSPGR